MIYGYARVSTDGQSVDAQGTAPKKHGAKKALREAVSAAKTNRDQLRRVIEQLAAGDVLAVTGLDRLTRSTCDLLNALAAIGDKTARFRALGDSWADSTTAHARPMLTVLGGLAGFERDLIRARTSEAASAPRHAALRRSGGTAAMAIRCARSLQLQCRSQHDFASENDGRAPQQATMTSSGHDDVWKAICLKSRFKGGKQ